MGQIFDLKGNYFGSTVNNNITLEHIEHYNLYYETENNNYTYNKPQYFLKDLALSTRSNIGLPETKSFVTGKWSYELNKKSVKSVINVNAFVKILNVNMSGFSHNVINALVAPPYNLSASRITISSVIEMCIRDRVILTYMLYLWVQLNIMIYI